MTENTNLMAHLKTFFLFLCSSACVFSFGQEAELRFPEQSTSQDRRSRTDRMESNCKDTPFSTFGETTAPYPAMDTDWNLLPSDSLIALIQTHYFNQGQLSRKLLSVLYQRAKTSGSPDLLVWAVYLDALTEYTQHADEGELSNRIDSLLQSPGINRNAAYRTLLTYASALSKLSNGHYPEAFRDAMEAYRGALEINDTQILFNTANTLGNIGPYIQDYALSGYYYEEARKYAKNGSLEWCRLMLNQSRLLYLENDFDGALRLIHQIIPYLDSLGQNGIKATAYLNMGSYWVGKGERDSGYAWYMRSMEQMKNLDNNNIRLILLGNIGNHFRQKKAYDTALTYYRKARAMALDDGNVGQYASMAYEMSILFTETGQPDSAYHYLSEYNELISRIQQPQTVESYQNYVDMVMESSENQRKISEQALALKNKQFIIVVTVLSALVVATVLLMLFFLERRRSMRQFALLKEVENKELSDQLAYEQSIQKLQQDAMSQKLREITSYSLLLANKNHLLKDIEDLAVQAEKECGNQNCTKIRRLVEESLHMDGDYWQQFVGHFTQVNPHFFENLKQKFPDLTPNETKLCAYIRIGMSSKQIAQMLNLSPESVNKNRYRLRKKLGLDKDEALEASIASL